MKIHMVKSGDTMYTIAEKYHVALEQLISFNPQISDPNQIDVGMKVKIPKSTLPDHASMEYAHKHIVVQGDSLWKISKYWGLPLKALVDANPQLKNPSVLLTGETVYIPNTSPIHQAMTSNSANKAAPSQLYPANPNLPISENIQQAPNLQPPEQMPQAAPPITEQQAMPPQLPPQMPVEEKHAMPPQMPVKEKHAMPQQMPVEEKHAMPQQMPVGEKYAMPQQMPVGEKYAMPQPPLLQEQQYMPYAQPFMQPMAQPFSPIQQANIPEQKEMFNVYSSEHLFAQMNVPAVEAQGMPDYSNAMQMPAWDYGQVPQYPASHPYTAEMPTAMSFAPAYGSPKPDCGCGCGGTKQQENLMYYSNPPAMPQMQQGYYPQTSPYYGSQPMQPMMQSFPMQYPMSMQSPMQQPVPWDSAPAANMGYSPIDANYAYTMPYAFQATHPTAYMMPCYPMSTEMSYPPAMQLPYTMPYPYENMPHENNEAGWDDRANIETHQAVQETQTKQEVKASRKSTKNRPAQPAADDRAVLHQFLQRRESAEPVKENKSTSPWINY